MSRRRIVGSESFYQGRHDNFVRAGGDHYRDTDCGMLIAKTYPISLFAWTKHDTMTVDAGEWTLFCDYYSGTQWFHCRCDDSGDPSFNNKKFQGGYRQGGNFTRFGTTSNLYIDDDETWNSLSFSHGVDTSYFLMNGEWDARAEETDAILFPASTSGADSLIGSFNGSTDNWNGIITWFTLWRGYELSPTDHMDIHNGRHPWTIAPEFIIQGLIPGSSQSWFKGHMDNNGDPIAWSTSATPDRILVDEPPIDPYWPRTTVTVPAAGSTTASPAPVEMSIGTQSPTVSTAATVTASSLGILVGTEPTTISTGTTVTPISVGVLLEAQTATVVAPSTVSNFRFPVRGVF